MNYGRVRRRKWHKAISHSLKFLCIMHQNLGHEAICSRNAMRFNNLVRIPQHFDNFCQLAWHGLNSQKCRYSETKNIGIDYDSISKYRASVSEFQNALPDARAGQTYFLRKMFCGNSAIFGQCRDYLAINCVEVPGNITASVHGLPLAG